MTQHSFEDFGINFKGKVLLQLFNKRKLRNGTKTYLEQKIFSTVKFKKLGFNAPLSLNKNLKKLIWLEKEIFFKTMSKCEKNSDTF